MESVDEFHRITQYEAIHLKPFQVCTMATNDMIQRWNLISDNPQDKLSNSERHACLKSIHGNLLETIGVKADDEEQEEELIEMPRSLLEKSVDESKSNYGTTQYVTKVRGEVPPFDIIFMLTDARLPYNKVMGELDMMQKLL